MPGFLDLIVASALRAAASMAGVYDGGQTEIAASLALGEDGRFAYGLAYGALNEGAEGRWTQQGDYILLTSDPVRPPRFELVAQQPGPPSRLVVALELPDQLPPELFDVLVTYAGGRMELESLGRDGLSLPFQPGEPPVSVRLVLQMFEIAGGPVPLDPARGYSLRFRFEPNDLGKVDFRATPLQIEGGELLLERHGRLLRFRRPE